MMCSLIVDVMYPKESHLWLIMGAQQTALSFIQASSVESEGH